MAEDQLAALGAEEQEERLELSVKVEDSGPARKTLRIEVPHEQVEKKISEMFDNLQDEAQLPGFRRGRAPMRLLQKRFGQSVKDDVRAQLISQAYTQAVEDEKLDVLGQPEIKDAEEIKLPDEGPMVIEAEVEITPQFELPSLEGIEVNRPTKTITDEDLEEEIERLRERFGNLQMVEDAEVQDSDYLRCDVRILEGSDAADDATEIVHNPAAYTVAHGEEQEFKGHISGILIDDLGKQLLGKKPGDVIRISMTGPTGHEDERIKNQPITLVIRIDAVERLEPASMDVLQDLLGVESGDEVRERVREMLSHRREQEAQSQMREQICDHLLEKVEIELPEGLSSRQTSRYLQRTRIQMMVEGVPEQEIEQRVAELRSESEETARRQLKLFFLIAKASDTLDVSVSEGEINGQVAMMAREQGRRPEKLRQEMLRSGQFEQLYLQLREQKTLDKILESAKVNEESVEETKEKKAKKKTAKKKSSKKSSKKKAAAKKKEEEEGSEA